MAPNQGLAAFPEDRTRGARKLQRPGERQHPRRNVHFRRAHDKARLEQVGSSGYSIGVGRSAHRIIVNEFSTAYGCRALRSQMAVHHGVHLRAESFGIDGRKLSL